MSKGSLFWANARGKLGEAVYYRAGGEQRNRTYVRKIKNPKTLAQAYNRLSMLNFSTGFRALKPLIQVSFPNRLSNESGFNAFMKSNKTASSPVIDREASQEGLSVLSDMTIADGNISTLGVQKLYRNVDELDTGGSDFIGYDLAGVEDKYNQPGNEALTAAWDSFMTDAGFEPFDIIDTIDKFKNLLIIAGLPADTVIVVVRGEYEDIGYRYSYARFSADGFSGDASIQLNLFSNKIKDPDIQTNWNVRVGVRVDQTENDEEYFATIVAHKVNGKLDVTPTRLMTAGTTKTLTKQFQRGGDVYEQILAAYGPSEGNLLTIR